MRSIIRQGDVALELLIGAIPADVCPVPRELNRVVLAHGEITGHAHALEESGVSLYSAPDGSLYLSVTEPATLKHEEHAHVGIAPGQYRVHRQREYSPEEIRRVQD